MMKLPRAMLCFALFCLGPAANAGIVYFTESDPISAKVGDVFVLHVHGQDFSVGVDGGGLDIAFDSAKLQVDSMTVDSLWSDLFDDGSTDNSAGKVTDIYFNDFSMQGISGDFPILAVQFAAVGEGTSLVELNASAKFPFAGGASALPVEFSKHQVTIESALPVPEPSARASLLAGLALLTSVLAASSHLCGRGRRKPQAVRAGEPKTPATTPEER